MTIASRDQQRTRRVSVFLIAGLILLTILLSCCGEHPPKPEPVEYVLYYGNSANGDLYVFDADSLTIIDSIPNVGPPLSITASPDGRWLYVIPWVRPDLPFLKRYCTGTKQILDSLGDSEFGFLTTLDRGKFLLRGLYDCRNEVIDAASLASIGFVDDSICPIRGPASGTKVIAAVASDGHLCSYDVLGRTIEGNYAAHLTSGTAIEVVDAVLHLDGHRALVLGWEAGNHAWFLIGSLLTGETLLQYPLAYPQGQIAIDETGTIAAISDPSQQGILDTPPTVDLFDLDSLRHLKRFIGESGGELEGNLASVQFLPGTRLLYGVTGLTTSEAVIQVFNVESLTVVKTVHDPFPGGTTTEFTVAVKPR